MARWTMRELVLFTGLLIATGACDSETSGKRDGPDAGTPASDEAVELFSWWIAPGEAEALQALVDVHKAEHPGARILNAAAASGENARAILNERLDDGDPPDLFQRNASDIGTFLEAYPDGAAPLDDLIDELGIRKEIIPEALADVTFAGRVYAMPVNVHRENALFYNQWIFGAQGLEPPTTLAELLTVCEKLKAASITPLATSYQGWIQRIMFGSIAPAVMGVDKFQAYMQGKLAADDPSFQEALDTYARILADYTNADAGDEDFGWTEAAQAVYKGRAAMYFHGDWAKGYFVQLGWTPGVDFGGVGAPGAQDLFLYGVDTFLLSPGAPHADAARSFLETVASIDGQVVFNKVKGSSPMRLDVPPSALDAVGRGTLSDLKSAHLRMLARFPSAWDDAFGQYAKDRDRSALLAALVAARPSAR